VTERCCKWIAQKGLSSIYGAREILRYVQDKIKTYFVDEVLFGELSKGGTAIIDVVDGEIKISKKLKGDSRCPFSDLQTNWFFPIRHLPMKMEF